MNDTTIVGFGLAGSCLAWRLWQRGISFQIVDDQVSQCSKVAAGMINPVTGKNCTATWRYREFFDEAECFYQEIEKILSFSCWSRMESVRLIGYDSEEKLRSRMTEGDSAEWVEREIDVSDFGDEWACGYLLKNAARLNCKEFIEKSRNFFVNQGCVVNAFLENNENRSRVIWCEGARGLIAENPEFLRQRSAKGEMLVIKATGWFKSRMIAGNGWLLPLGNDEYKIGATYEWNDLDEIPTQKGREEIEKIARSLCAGDYEVIEHRVGIRPIVRESFPLLGNVDENKREYFMNALGSKGALTAPLAAKILVDYMIDGKEIEPIMNIQSYLEKLRRKK
jgi:glycine oxidase